MRKGFKQGEYEDLRGRTFGQAIVMNVPPIYKLMGRKRKREWRYWLVECLTCGHVSEKHESEVKRLTIGCKKCANKLASKRAAILMKKWPDSAVGSLYTSYRRNAEAKNLRFDLAYDCFQSLIIQDCVYCGAHPRLIATTGILRHTTMANGIDRKNNNLGYIEGNCVPCCSDCNYEKADLTKERVYKFFPHLRPTFAASDGLLY